MINAERARFKSKHQKEINKILETIEKNINKAISDGEFVCQTSIPVDTAQPVRDEIEEQMNILGYKITIPEKTVYTGPCEQTPWYDDIIVSWE